MFLKLIKGWTDERPATEGRTKSATHALYLFNRDHNFFLSLISTTKCSILLNPHQTHNSQEEEEEREQAPESRRAR